MESLGLDLPRRNPKALVTGGAGFIGSHLCEHLLSLGWEVVVLDDLSTGSRDNLENVIRNDSLWLVVGSVTDADLVNRLAEDVDVIFHMAAAVGVMTIQNETLSSLHTNLKGTECVLDAAVKSGAMVVLASTSEVYGKNMTQGLTEEADRVLGSPLLSRWSYAEAKALDETLTQQHFLHKGVRTVIVRLFNTSGPRQSGRYGMVLPRFVRQALTNTPITVYGDGEQTRCFTNVHDVVPALVRLQNTPAAIGEVFNIGGNEQISMNELAEKVRELTGSTSEIVHVDYRTAYGDGYEDMRCRVPDCSKIARTIGFKTSRTLLDTIEMVIESERSKLAVAAPRGPLAS